MYSSLFRPRNLYRKIIPCLMDNDKMKNNYFMVPLIIMIKVLIEKHVTIAPVSFLLNGL
tara:strand:+ start:1240 stop:1416 length:177 start_codon:yes stop_codon:yes gene_type:complete